MESPQLDRADSDRTSETFECSKGEKVTVVEKVVRLVAGNYGSTRLLAPPSTWTNTLAFRSFARQLRTLPLNMPGGEACTLAVAAAATYLSSCSWLT